MSQTIEALDYGKLNDRRGIVALEREKRFTRVYRQYAVAHPYVRELHCLACQTELLFLSLGPDDLFAGHTDRMFVGIDPERGDVVETAYFCQRQLLAEQRDNPQTDARLRADIEELLDFWQDEVTHRRCRERFTPEMNEGLPSDSYYECQELSFPMFGLGGPCLDYDRLLTLGIGGLRAQVNDRLRSAQDADSDAFLQGLIGALDIFTGVAVRYAQQADALARSHPQRAADLTRLRDDLYHICEDRPKTYAQAIQLFWLYSLMSLTRNYGRMDVYLGDFLAQDLAEGRLTPDEGDRLTLALWRMIARRTDNFNNRVIVGGLGRRNTANADLFAGYAMRAQAASNEPIPQLSLRCHEGMDEALWEQAFDTLAAGSTFPILYNDDVNVAAAQKALGATPEDALQYVMYGCGEYLIEHRGVGSPDAALNVAKLLDVTLHNGVNSQTGARMGLALGSLTDYPTFEALMDAFAQQVRHQMRLLCQAQETIYNTIGDYAAYPFLSLLVDDCIARGRPLMKGGARYRGGIVECFGNTTASDALTAIRQLVYEEKKLTAEQLLAALAADFAGFERERKLLRAAPKYGNDDACADGMNLRMNGLLCEAAQAAAEGTTLHSFNVVLINNGDSVLYGKRTAATADGRRAGTPLSNGNQPSAGNDVSGITALLHSMAKLPPALHAGVVHNLKVSRGMMTQNRAQVRALCRGYFLAGGTQLMLTITDAQELRDALVHPEAYANLMVRVGGYSDRFLHLSPEVQQEVIARTLYEA